MRNKSHKCEKCGHNFTYAWNLKQHLKHNKNCGSLEEEFKCSNCGKKYTLGSTLKHHFARCIAVDPYRFACSHCPRKFTFKSSLRKHIKERCPNINYASNTQPDSESNSELVEYEALEEVHADDIDFTESDVTNECIKDNTDSEKTPPQFDDSEEKFTIIENEDIDVQEETSIALQFTYEDSCNDIIEYMEKEN